MISALAVLLSALSVPFVFGLRIHFFQVAIIILHVPAFVMQTILVTLTVEDVIWAQIADVLQTYYHAREVVFPNSGKPTDGSRLVVLNRDYPAVRRKGR